MTSRWLSVLLSCSFVSVFVLSAATAVASSGHVSGTVYFHQANGGYCPSSEACTGSTYFESSYDELVGIPEALIEVIRASDNAVLGSSETDAGGQYSIEWSSGGGSSDVDGKIRVRYRHKDARFWFHTVQNTPHSVLNTVSSTITLAHGTTFGSP